MCSDLLFFPFMKLFLFFNVSMSARIRLIIMMCLTFLFNFFVMSAEDLMIKAVNSSGKVMVPSKLNADKMFLKA